MCSMEPMCETKCAVPNGAATNGTVRKYTRRNGRTKPVGILKQLEQFVRYWYFQWELITSLYMLEPIEKVICYVVLFAFLAAVLYACTSLLLEPVITVLYSVRLDT